MYWVFNEGQLSLALAAWEAHRQREGASEQQAKDEIAVIVRFLASASAAGAKLIGSHRD